jgi:simple sugar transport system ATP-binding protein
MLIAWSVYEWPELRTLYEDGIEMSAALRLKLEGIVKEYPGCRANDGIDLTVEAGEIHALLGENGAGKSTLMKVIYGVIQPDAGQMIWNGHPVTVESPARAREMGIGMVFQHFSLFETLTVAENIALGLPAYEARDRRKLDQRIREVSEHYGMALDPRRYVSTLSMGERQRVEIVRCLIQESTLLILDEPTSVLTPQEVRTLFTTLRQLAKEGCSILFISHKLEEVRSLCDRATVLRQGRVSGDCRPADVSTTDIARLMVGDDTPISTDVSRAKPGESLLKVRELSWKTSDPFGTSLERLNLELRQGEIVGIAGVAGNGQDELLKALSGEILLAPEIIELAGKPIGNLSPGQRRKRGIEMIYQDLALARQQDVASNIFLGREPTRRILGMNFVDRARMNREAQEMIDRLGARLPAISRPVGSFSGGQQQSVAIARALTFNPKIVIMDEPTAALAVREVQSVLDLIAQMKAEGIGVVLISHRLNDVLSVTDRIVVLRHGYAAADLVTRRTSMAEVVSAIVGGDDQSRAAAHEALG